MIDGEEVFAILGTSSAVFAFRENRAAAFDTFAVLIPAADQFNLREFELLAGNDSPTGVFESIGRFVTVNSRIIDTPYQEFRFPEVKAKYLKVTALDTHFKPSPANGSLMAYEIMLFGRLL